MSLGFWCDTPQTARLKGQKVLVSKFWRLEVRNQGVSRTGPSRRCPYLSHSVRLCWQSLGSPAEAGGESEPCQSCLIKCPGPRHLPAALERQLGAPNKCRRPSSQRWSGGRSGGCALPGVSWEEVRPNTCALFIRIRSTGCTALTSGC